MPAIAGRPIRITPAITGVATARTAKGSAEATLRATASMAAVIAGGNRRSEAVQAAPTLVNASARRAADPTTRRKPRAADFGGSWFSSGREAAAFNHPTLENHIPYRRPGVLQSQKPEDQDSRQPFSEVTDLFASPSGRLTPNWSNPGW